MRGDKMNVNLNLYKYFYEVAKYSSYTKAASVMMISQPSLSYSVKVLENQLNLKLFKKVNNKIQLTDEGKKLYERLHNVFCELDKIINVDDEISGILKLGVRSAYANRVLPFYIGEISKIYPDLKIQIIVGTSENLLKMLKNNEVDIIIDECYYEDEIYTSFPTNFPMLSTFFTSIDESNQINEIKDYNYFLKQNIYIVDVNKICSEMKSMYPEFKYIDVQSTAVMINMIKKNKGVGFTQKALINEELMNKTLSEIETDFPLPKSEVYLTYISKIENNKILAFANFMKEHALEDINYD